MGEATNPLLDPASIAAAVGALGLASFSLVDASKALPGGGASAFGFEFIESAVKLFEPNATRAANTPLLAASLLQILQANWINGMAAQDQKAVARSLIKLRLNSASAERYAKVTDVDGDVLKMVAQSMTTGQALNDQQGNALGRFDLALTAIIDAAYQRADQRYRNACKAIAAGVSVVIALLGGWTVFAHSATGSVFTYFGSVQFYVSALAGLLAVPLAPIAKDLASALSAGVKVAQSLRKA